MKRLLPIGEEARLQINPSELTKEEKEFYINAHNKILISTEVIQNVQDILSSNGNSKHTLV